MKRWISDWRKRILLSRFQAKSFAKDFMTVARKKYHPIMKQQFNEWKKRARLLRPEAKSIAKDLLTVAR